MIDGQGAWTCVDRRSNQRSIPHHGLTRFRFPFLHLDTTGAHLERGHHVAALVAAGDLPRPRRDARGLLHFQHQVSEPLLYICCLYGFISNQQLGAGPGLSSFRHRPHQPTTDLTPPLNTPILITLPKGAPGGGPLPLGRQAQHHRRPHLPRPLLRG